MSNIGALGRFTLWNCLSASLAPGGWSRSRIADVDEKTQAAMKKRWPNALFIPG